LKDAFRMSALVPAINLQFGNRTRRSVVNCFQMFQIMPSSRGSHSEIPGM
jgi:hypothetical protein